MQTHRRKFLKGSLAAATAPALVPATVQGANDRPTYGLIGAGRRGRYLSRIFQEFGAECVALCDVYEPSLKIALKDAPRAKTYPDSGDLMQHNDLDFVVVATPDHHHCPMLLEGLAAGKDVYLEKPMSHSIAESAQMIEAVRKTSQIVQVGMQRRSSEFMFKAKKVIDDGTLGRITMVRTQWKWNFARPLSKRPPRGKLDWERFQGPARRRPFDPLRFNRWRSFWDYSGGNTTDQGTHLMDVIQWFTGSGTPRSAVLFGQVAKMVGAEAPDVFCATFEYPSHVSTFTLNYCNDYQTHWSFEFQGDRATLLLDPVGFQVFEEPQMLSIQTRDWWKEHSKPIMDVAGKVLDSDHVKNFLDCIRTREEPTAPVEVGASGVAAPHLANIAFHKGRQVRLAPDGVTLF